MTGQTGNTFTISPLSKEEIINQWTTLLSGKPLYEYIGMPKKEQKQKEAGQDLKD